MQELSFSDLCNSRNHIPAYEKTTAVLVSSHLVCHESETKGQRPWTAACLGSGKLPN